MRELLRHFFAHSAGKPHNCSDGRRRTASRASVWNEAIACEHLVLKESCLRATPGDVS
jgi:hypothetical protein